ncbi:PEGA domain-containing protein [Candidatus Aminicenantes bacterium AC-335-G13]|nr:PEGA domain-containing protein [Candidatus Aminicenantes bacterium AC-335-G13]MCP2606252.1 PEGA domain-containing protein [Candidatus Aminicenantes bacterium AC-708-I09]
MKKLKMTRVVAYMLIGAFLFYLNAVEISYSQSKSPDSYIQEGKELYKKGAYGESLKRLERAEFYYKTIEHKTKEERLAEIYFYQGLNFIKKGEREIAKEMFKKAIRFAPDRDYSGELMSEEAETIFNSAKAEVEVEISPEAMGMPANGNGGGSSAAWAVLAVIALAAVGVLAYLLLKSKAEEKEKEKEPDIGSIQVNSTPSGATIYLDGQNTGQVTPATVTNVSVGSHTVKLEKERYQSWETTVNVVKNQTITVDATLKPGSFTENFNDGKAQYWKNASENASWYVQGGVYKCKGPHTEFARAYYNLGKFDNNWTYEAKINRLQGKAYHVLGLAFGGNNDFSVYYVLDIAPGWQNWSIWKADERGTHKEWNIVPWTKDTAINEHGWNKCKIVANGNTFTFYVNGKKLKTVTISGVPSKGKIGLWTYVYSSMDIAGFDDVKFTYGSGEGVIKGEFVIPKLAKPGESSIRVR